MSNVFKDVQKGAGNVEASLLGPDYNYAKAIKPPSEMGMSTRGSMSALAWNIAGISDYVNVLVSGDSRAQRNGGRRPLGQRFYLKTAAQCCSDPVLDEDGNQIKCNKKHDRYMFIDNIPSGRVPFISSASNSNFQSLRGLVPGTMENVGKINPLEMISGFMAGAYPKCRKLKIKSTSSVGPKSNVYVADSDIANLSGCLWNSKGKPRKRNTRDNRGRNPVSGEVTSGCAEGFKIMNEKLSNKNYAKVKNNKNTIDNLYNLGFSSLLIYLMYRLITKHN